MSFPVGALWNKNSNNPKAPLYYGSLEIRDRELAMKIAEQLVKGERVRISVFRGKGMQDGKNYPDYNIVLDTYEKTPSKQVDEISF